MLTSSRIPEKLNLALLPTPLENMPRLTQALGGPNIYFKRDDLTGCTLSGNKIRKLEFSLAEARAIDRARRTASRLSRMRIASLAGDLL